MTIRILSLVLFLGLFIGEVQAQSFVSDGTFGQFGRTLAVGDLDGDGFADVVSAAQGVGTAWYKGNGTGALVHQSTFSSDVDLGVAIVDFDGVNGLDVVFASGYPNNSLSCGVGGGTQYPCEPNKVWLNNGSGGFTQAWSDGFSHGSWDVAVGDFNGDAFPDFAVSNSPGPSTVWLNNGVVGAGFGFTQVSLTASISARGVAVGDFNGDAWDDIAFSDGTVLLSTAAGAWFESVGLLGASGISIDAGNMDGATRDDIVITGNYGQNRVFLNDGAGVFTGLTGFGKGDDPRFGSAIADLDNDGDLDLAVTGYAAIVAPFESYYLNNGSGVMTPSVLNPWGGKGIGIGDLTGDGRVEVLVGDDPNIVFKNFGANVVTTVADDGPGSLRKAIQFANANTGTTISFAIPGGGLKTIALATALPPITETTMIDGYTQPGATANTAALFQPGNAVLQVYIDGSGVGSGDGIKFSGHDGSSVRGLMIAGFPGNAIVLLGSGHTAAGNYLGTDGSTYLGRGGLFINSGSGNMVGGPNPADRNVIAGGGIGHEPGGINSIIRGNFIGTNAAGSAVIGTGAQRNFNGIASNQGTGGQALDNLISGSQWHGISLSGPNAGQTVMNWTVSGNRIGTDATGTLALPNDRSGVRFQKGAHDTEVLTNIIAFNGFQGGVFVAKGDGVIAPDRITVRGNSIFSNGAPGIHLLDGANGAIATPSISQAYISASGDLTVRVVVLATGDVELFEADSQASGEGKTLLGAPVSYPASGVSQTYVLGNAAALGVTAGEYVVATITDATGNTSPFAVPLDVSATNPLVVRNTNDSGQGSLRDAIEFANTNGGFDNITFAIPGAATDVHRIQPLDPLPPLAGVITIDGTSQGDAQCEVPGHAQRKIRIEIDGSLQSGNNDSHGFLFTGSGNTVTGVAIFNMPKDGVHAEAGTSVNKIRCSNIGTDAAGLLPMGNGRVGAGMGVMVRGNNVSVERNVILANSYHEIGIEGAVTGASVTDNYIGVNSALARVQSNLDVVDPGQVDRVGIGVSGSGHTFRYNLVGGFFQSFVVNASTILIDQNLIGVGPGGENVASTYGIRLATGSGSTISGNTISRNGVGLQISTGSGHRVTANSFFDNGATAFTIAPGANADIAAPSALVAEVDGSGNLTLSATAAVAGDVEFFIADSQGSGEGKTLIGAAQNYTNTGLQQSFAMGPTTTLGVNIGDFVVATITDGSNNTSVFSAPVAVVLAAPANPLEVTTDADSGPGSLRAALAWSNDNPSGGAPNEITFAIDLGGNSSAVIRPASALPLITAPVIINGLSQTGATCGTSIQDRVLKIVLDGSLMAYVPAGPNANALEVDENVNNVSILGLNINQFPGSGVRVRDGNSNVIIRCNYIGTDELGTGAFGNYGHGVQIEGYGNASTLNWIGGPDPADGNLISANGGTEIAFEPGANSNTVQNNYIGTTKTGAALLTSNLSFDPHVNQTGIGVNQGRGNSFLGNIIGGFIGGVELVSSPTAPDPGGNIVRGNSIGTDASGLVDLGNNLGVVLSGSGNGAEVIGGPTLGHGNQIKYNGTGVVVVAAPNHVVEGNLIQANSGPGVSISGSLSPGLTISTNSILDNGQGVLAIGGGGGSITGNTISGNSGYGVELSNASTNYLVDGNTIGLADDGDTPYGNGSAGIWIVGGSSGNVISGNTVSENQNSGIVLTGGAEANTVTDNVVGLNQMQTAARPNLHQGLAVTHGATLNLITGNVFSGNTLDGVVLWEAGEANSFEGNFIGTSAGGTPFGNGGAGIQLAGFDTGSRTLIGGAVPGQGNVIANNAASGILVKDPASPAVAPFPNATISRNSIYANGLLGIDLTTTDVSPLGNGITANDGADTDVGPNGLLNTPGLQAARLSGSSLAVDLYMKAGTGTTLTVEFFRADANQDEGQVYLGSATAASNDLLHTASLSGLGVVAGDYVVATATDALGNTSEFSAGVRVEDVPVTVPSGYVFETIVSSGLVQPSALALGTDDAVYVADATQNAVYQYDFTGGAYTPLTISVSGPTGLAVSPTGTVFVVDANGVRSQTAAIPTNVTTPRVVAFGPDGCRYITGASGIERTCAATTTMIVTGAIDGRGLAWDATGALFVSRGNGEIATLAAGTQGSVAIGSLPVVQTGLVGAGAMSFSEGGLLFVSTTAGVQYGRPNALSLSPFALLSGGGPNGLAIGSKSRLFVSHASEGKVFRFSIPALQDPPTVLTFELSERLNQMMPGVEAAIQGAFATWHGVGSALASSKIAYGGLAPGGAYAASIGDYKNLITVDPSFPIGSQTLAVASKLIRVGATPELSEVVTADIIFNDRFNPVNQNGTLLGNFGTDAQPAEHDIRGIATHELGHTMGLIHSGVPDATMFFILPKTARTLQADDIAQVSRLYPNAGQAGNFGTISGRVLSGNPTTLNRPVAGALLIANDLSNGNSVHAYSDRDGNYQIKYLPTGNYRVGLYALDGSLFQAKWPLTPPRVSLLLSTITTETSFLEEYYNGAGESATDDRSLYTLVSVGAGGVSGGINLITNLDTTAPRVTSITPKDADAAVALRPNVSITFSEGVKLGTPTATIRLVSCATTGCAQPLDLTLDKDGGRFALATVTAPLQPNALYELSVNGALDAAGNRQTAAFTSRFTTRDADTTPPTIVATFPAAGANDVSTSTVISVSFSEPMDTATITSMSAVVVRQSGTATALDGALSLPSNTSLNFKLTDELLSGVAYELVLTGLKDVSGNSLPDGLLSPPGTVIIPFSTPTVPAFTQGVVGPIPGATGVSIDTHVFVDFSLPLDQASVTASSFILHAGGPTGPVVPGHFAFANSGRRLVFRPTVSLGTLSDYTVETTALIKDNLGRDLGNPGTWSFSTGLGGFQALALSPRTAFEGALITVEGTGFNPNPSLNTVTFSGAASPAEITKATGSSLTVRVPFGATSGPVVVNVPNSGTGTLQFDLYVPPATLDPARKIASTESSPRDVEVSPDGALAVVTNSGANSVSIIEVATGHVFPPVSVGKTPLRVVLTSDGSRAYVTNFDSHTVSVIDLGCATTGETECVETIPVGFNPIGIDISADGSLVFVAEYSSKSVSIIDINPASVSYNLAIKTINTDATTREASADPDGAGKILATDSSPRDVESNPDGTGIWIATDFGIIASQVSLTVPQSEWGVTLLVSESSAREANVNPDGGITILASDGGATGGVIVEPDGGTTIRTGEGTVRDVDSNPDGTMLFMTTAQGALLVYAIPSDPYGSDAYKAVTTLGSEASAREAEVSPDGTLVYVTSYATSSVSVYKFGAGLTTDGPTAVSGIGFGLVLIEVISVGNGPEGLAYSPVGDFAVVANSGSDTVSIVEFTRGGTAPPPGELGDPTEEDGDGDGVSDVRTFIRSTIESLLLAAQTADDIDDYEKAYQHADRNLDPALWIAGTTMPSEKKGKKVFDNDKQIVKALARIVARNGSGAATAAALIEQYLIPLDRAIAVTAMEEATEAIRLRRVALDNQEALLRDSYPNLKCGKKDKVCKEAVKALEDGRKDLDKAEKELVKASDDLSKADAQVLAGDFDKAFDSFKKVWDHTGHAQDDLAGKGYDESDEEEELPFAFELDQNYPNPFNPVTTINFAIPETAEVQLVVFDLLGRQVQTLVSHKLDAGYHSVQFDGSRLSSGVYLYRINAGTFTKVQRMVLMK